jgi:hypothetical protein
MTDTTSRNIGLAREFLRRLGELDDAGREQIRLPDVHSDPHLGLFLSARDAVHIASNAPGGPSDRMEQFLREIQPEIERLAGDSRELADAIAAAATGILAHTMPAQQVVMRELYAPFESVVPWASLAPKRRGRG